MDPNRVQVTSKCIEHQPSKCRASSQRHRHINVPIRRGYVWQSYVQHAFNCMWKHTSSARRLNGADWLPVRRAPASCGFGPQRSYFRLFHTCRPNSEKNTKLYACMAACSLRALGRGNQTPAGVWSTHVTSLAGRTRQPITRNITR